MSHLLHAVKSPGRREDKDASAEITHLNRLGALLHLRSNLDIIRRTRLLLAMRGRLQLHKRMRKGINPPDFITPETISEIVEISRKGNLITQTDPRWRGGLSLIASVAPGMPFGILNGPKDLAILLNLRGFQENISPTTWAMIDNFLQVRARDVVGEIKRRLGIKFGRPRDSKKTRRWTLGAEYRQKGYSWAKITLKLDPDGYAADRKGATDRMRLGIRSIMKKKLRKASEARKVR